jgi:hypothetical protein
MKLHGEALPLSTMISWNSDPACDSAVRVRRGKPDANLRSLRPSKRASLNRLRHLDLAVAPHAHRGGHAREPRPSPKVKCPER